MDETQIPSTSTVMEDSPFLDSLADTINLAKANNTTPEQFEVSYKPNKWYENEFSELESLAQATIQRRTTSSNSLAINRRRNRYHDIVPFDSTRVKLHKPLPAINDLEASDYINASFITDCVTQTMELQYSTAQGKNIRRQNSRQSNARQHTISVTIPNNKAEIGTEPESRYIAAQGPDETTIPLFWEMIWQQNVRVIVMLTNLVENNCFGGSKAKCSMYWPPVVGSCRRYNDFEVQLYDVQEAPDYTVRKFDVSRRVRHRSGDNDCCGANREIVHIQYTSWPDRSAPQEPEKLLQLIDLTRILSHQYNNRCENNLSISSIKPAEKTMMSASTLDITDENAANQYSSVKKVHPNAGQWLVHCSAGVGRTGNMIYLHVLFLERTNILVYSKV